MILENVDFTLLRVWTLSVIAKIPFLFFFFKRLIFKIYMKLIYLGWVSEN